MIIKTYFVIILKHCLWNQRLSAPMPPLQALPAEKFHNDYSPSISCVASSWCYSHQKPVVYGNTFLRQQKELLLMAFSCSSFITRGTVCVFGILFSPALCIWQVCLWLIH